MPKLLQLDVLLAAACLVVLGFGALLNIQFGLDNILLLGAFNVDETLNLNLVMRSVHRNNLDPSGFYYYGYLYHTLGFAVAKFYQLLGDHVRSVRFIGSMLRLI